MDTNDLARLFALIALAAILLSGAVVVGAIGLRFAGRRPGRRWGTAVAFLFGIQLGVFILFTEGDAIQRAVILAVVGLLTLGLLWRDRRVQAGAFLAGSALPWTAVWGYYAFELVRGVPGEPFQTWTMFGLGLAPTLIGLGLMVAGDPLPPEPSPSAPAGQPGLAARRDRGPDGPRTGEHRPVPDLGDRCIRDGHRHGRRRRADRDPVPAGGRRADRSRGLASNAVRLVARPAVLAEPTRPSAGWPNGRCSGRGSSPGSARP